MADLQINTTQDGSLISLRSKQIQTLEKMLNLNHLQTSDLTSSTDTSEIIWKVLILDSKSTQIISSVLRVNDLLKSGITMHTNLHSNNRSPIPDIPAVYFVEPNVENINRIVSDIANDTYLNYYINFTSTLSRDLLETLASGVAQTGKSELVLQVYDQYLNYVVTEPNLFSLGLGGVYRQFHDVKSTEEDIIKLADKITDGLFDAIITMFGDSGAGSIPVIRCQNGGGAAELIAGKLDVRLRDYVISTKSASVNSGGGFSPYGGNSDRAVLVLVDRDLDISAMFAHSWIYQCLVADVFKLERNTITIEESAVDPATGSSKKQYDIDPKDWFWNSNAHLPFPDAVDNADMALKEYKEKAAELTRGPGSANIEELDRKDDQLQQTVQLLPELTARKQIIDLHMNVLLSLLNELKAKGLDAFFEIEQALTDPKTRATFLDVLKKDEHVNNLEDKLRTFIVLYLTTDLPADYVSEVESILSRHEDFDMSAFQYVKRLKDRLKQSSLVLDSYTNSGNTNSGNNSYSTGDGNSALFSNLSSKLFNLADGKIQELGSVGSLITSLKTLLPSQTPHLPLTNILHSIMDPTSSTDSSLKITDEYGYFDPKDIRGLAHFKKPKRETYNKAMVFVVGGGNYVEFQNLQEWALGYEAKGKDQESKKEVVYGCDWVYNSRGFLKEISGL